MEDFLKAVDEVTLKDITSISQKLISSPLTMASYGDGISLVFEKIYCVITILSCVVVILSLYALQFYTFQAMNQ